MNPTSAPSGSNSCSLLLLAALLALSVGCASSASVRRDKQFKTAEEYPLQEQEAFRAAAEQYLQDTKDQPQTSPGLVLVAGTVPVTPRPECTDRGCPTAVTCKEVNAVCWVTHCGKGGCDYCPEPLPEAFKNLVFKQWCAFECVQGPLRIGTAIGFVPSIGNFFIGPFGCPTE